MLQRPSFQREEELGRSSVLLRLLFSGGICWFWVWASTGGQESRLYASRGILVENKRNSKMLAVLLGGHDKIGGLQGLRNTANDWCFIFCIPNVPWVEDYSANLKISGMQKFSALRIQIFELRTSGEGPWWYISLSVRSLRSLYPRNRGKPDVESHTESRSPWAQFQIGMKWSPLSGETWMHLRKNYWNFRIQQDGLNI